MKRLVSAIGLAVVFSGAAYAQGPTIKQYPYLYKSPRAMGMGGAYVAVGGTTDTIFYNPAGLSNMPKRNWEVNLLGISADVGKNSIDFVRDIQDAFDVGDADRDGDRSDDQLKAVNEVIAKYRGKNLHAGLANFSSIGRNQGSWAFALGGLASARVDAIPHQGLSSEGLLEVNADATGGGLLGLSFKVFDGFHVGATVKALHRESLVHKFTAREIVENQDNIEDYIIDELRKSGNAVGFDAGVLYKFAQTSWLRPSVGVSVMNIGDLKFGEAGKIPMTVNAGVAVSPKIPVFKSLTLGADYVDILNNYEEDKDKGKRIRVGAELQLVDNRFFGLGVRAGVYQGYPTFGADLRLLLLTVSYATYAEELGAYAGQDKDRRHVLFINLGW